MADPFFLKTYREEKAWMEEETGRKENPVIPAKEMRHTFKRSSGKTVTHHGSLLSWNTKTRSLSFDIPALQTCPGAKASLRLTGQDERKPGICSLCYASKGTYVWPSMKSVMQMRLRFSRGPDFVETMIEAIRNRKRKYLSSEYDARLDDPRFFRVHSSGDIYDGEYARKWTAICREFPDTLFWFPTRAWAADQGWLAGYRNEVVGLSLLPNVILRPSMLRFNDFPVLDMRDEVKWAAATGGLIFRNLDVQARAGKAHITAPAMPELESSWKKMGVWFCPATPRDHEDGKISDRWNCVSQNCRRCWTHPELPVVYRVH